MYYQDDSYYQQDHIYYPEGNYYDGNEQYYGDTMTTAQEQEPQGGDKHKEGEEHDECHFL